MSGLPEHPFEAWTSLSARMVIDATTLYWEHLRVRKALREGDDVHLSVRLRSLTEVLDEMVLVLKALKIGSSSEPLVELLDAWALAGEKQLVLGAPALHAYAVLSGVKIKPLPSSSFNLDENQELESWLRQATETGVLLPNVTEQVIFSVSGRPGAIHVLGPLSFVKFHRWLNAQLGRSVLQIRQTQKQIDVVERLVSEGHLSATYDLY